MKKFSFKKLLSLITLTHKNFVLNDEQKALKELLGPFGWKVFYVLMIAGYSLLVYVAILF